MRSRIAVLALLAATLVVAPRAEAATWPGGASVATADAAGQLGTEISGLAYQPAGAGVKGVMWAVKNDPGTLFKLVHDGTQWVPATNNGWDTGKPLRLGNNTGNPDAEGVTLAGGDTTGIYVSIERNDVNAGGSNNISRPSVMRYSTTTADATPLAATNEWALVGDLPAVGANAGLEAITWVPDSVLVAKGLRDVNTGVAYDPATYPSHGSGLFFVGLEGNGLVYAYALKSDNTFTRVTSFDSGFGQIMELEFDAATGEVWAGCDDHCQGRSRTFAIDGTGAFALTAAYDRPAGMANLNTEGFAFAGVDECVNGVRPAYFADDDGTDGHALREGTLSRGCPVPQTPGGSNTGGGQQQQQTTTPAATPPAATTPLTPPPALPPARDTVKPTVSGVSVKRASVTFTLSEPAKVTITVEKRSGAKFKKLKALSLSGKRGKQTVKLTGKLKSQTRRGKLRFTVGATDAAGNKATVARRTVG